MTPTADESTEWADLDEWQSQIESDFDYIYDTLRSVKKDGSVLSRSYSSTPKPSTPYPSAVLRSSSVDDPFRAAKKSVVFGGREEIQLIDDEEEEVGEVGEEIVEEEEYNYGGLLRPVSHKAFGTAKSFEHYLNTQDLSKNVQRLKSPSGDDHVRVRRHRKRRSRSPNVIPTVVVESDSDYGLTPGSPSRVMLYSGNKSSPGSNTA